MINGLGAVVTATATVIFLFTKFIEGAWAVAVAIPLLIVLFDRVEVYYTRVSKVIGIDVTPGPPVRKHTKVVVPVTNVSRLTHRALSEALSLSDDPSHSDYPDQVSRMELLAGNDVHVQSSLVQIDAGPERHALILPAEDTLFTSGTLGRYSTVLHAVMESHTTKAIGV